MKKTIAAITAFFLMAQGNCFSTGEKLPHGKTDVEQPAEKVIVDLSRNIGDSGAQHYASSPAEPPPEKKVFVKLSKNIEMPNAQVYPHPSAKGMIVVYSPLDVEPDSGRPSYNFLQHRLSKRNPAGYRTASLPRACGIRGDSSVDAVLESLIGCDDSIGGGWHAKRYLPRRHLHKGIDIFADEGCPIYAFENGVVTHVRLSNYRQWSGGKIVDIMHDGTGILPSYISPIFITKYMHCSEIIVHEGERVQKGQVIAYVGRTGFRNVGPHLHFETHEKRGSVAVPVDPRQFIQMYLNPEPAESFTARQEN